MGWIRNSFTSLAMVDYPYPASFLAPLPAYPVTVSCNYLLEASDVLVGIANAAGMMYCVCVMYSILCTCVCVCVCVCMCNHCKKFGV